MRRYGPIAKEVCGVTTDLFRAFQHETSELFLESTGELFDSELERPFDSCDFPKRESTKRSLAR